MMYKFTNPKRLFRASTNGRAWLGREGYNLLCINQKSTQKERYKR